MFPDVKMHVRTHDTTNRGRRGNAVVTLILIVLIAGVTGTGVYLWQQSVVPEQQASFEAQTSELERQITAGKDAADAATKMQTDYESKVLALQSKVTALEQEKQTAETTIAQLKKSNDILTTKTTSLEKLITKMEEDAKTMRSRLVEKATSTVPVPAAVPAATETVTVPPSAQ